MSVSVGQAISSGLTRAQRELEDLADRTAPVYGRIEQFNKTKKQPKTSAEAERIRVRAATLSRREASDVKSKAIARFGGAAFPVHPDGPEKDPWNRFWYAIVTQESGGIHTSGTGRPVESRTKARGIAQLTSIAIADVVQSRAEKGDFSLFTESGKQEWIERTSRFKRGESRVRPIVTDDEVIAGEMVHTDLIRRNALLNLEIGREHFHSKMKEFGGDVYKAITAYNAGSGSVLKAVAAARAAKSKDWIKFLPKNENKEYAEKVLHVLPDSKSFKPGTILPITNAPKTAETLAPIVAREIQVYQHLGMDYPYLGSVPQSTLDFVIKQMSEENGTDFITTPNGLPVQSTTGKPKSISDINDEAVRPYNVPKVGRPQSLLESTFESTAEAAPRPYTDYPKQSPVINGNFARPGATPMPATKVVIPELADEATIRRMKEENYRPQSREDILAEIEELKRLDREGSEYTVPEEPLVLAPSPGPTAEPTSTPTPTPTPRPTQTPSPMPVPADTIADRTQIPWEIGQSPGPYSDRPSLPYSAEPTVEPAPSPEAIAQQQIAAGATPTATPSPSAAPIATAPPQPTEQPAPDTLDYIQIAPGQPNPTQEGLPTNDRGIVDPGAIYGNEPLPPPIEIEPFIPGPNYIPDQPGLDYVQPAGSLGPEPARLPPPFPVVEDYSYDRLQSGEAAYAITNNDGYFKRAADTWRSIVKTLPSYNIANDSALLLSKSNEDILTAEQANRLYPDLPEKFSGPVSSRQAAYTALAVKERALDAKWASLGGGSDFVTSLAVGIAAWYGDPVILAASALAGPIVGAATGALATKIAARFIPRSVAKVVLDSTAIAAPTTGVYAASRKLEHDPMTGKEIALEIGANIGFDIGAHLGAKGIRYLIGAAKRNTRLKEALGGESTQRTFDAIRKFPEKSQEILGNILGRQAKREAGFGPNGEKPDFMRAKHGEGKPNAENVAGRTFYLPLNENGRVIKWAHTLINLSATDSLQAAKNIGNKVLPFKLKEGFVAVHADTPVFEVSPRLKTVDDWKEAITAYIGRVEPAWAHEFGRDKLLEALPKVKTIGELFHELSDLEGPENGMNILRKVLFREKIGGVAEVIHYEDGPVSTAFYATDHEALAFEPEIVDIQGQMKGFPDDPSEILGDDQWKSPELETKIDAEVARGIGGTEQELSPATVEKGPNPVAQRRASGIRFMLDAAAESDPLIKQRLIKMDEEFQADFVTGNAVLGLADDILTKSLATHGAAVDISRDTIRNILISNNVPFSSELFEQIVHMVDTLSKAAEGDHIKFKDGVIEMKKDILGFAKNKKIEREFQLHAFYEGKKLIDQEVMDKLKKRPASVAEKTYSLIIGGEHRINHGLSGSNSAKAESIAATYIDRLWRGWGSEGTGLMRSGGIDLQFVHELYGLERGSDRTITGNKKAYELAKVYYDVMSSIFNLRSGASPFLRKIPNYFFKQTHDRAKIRALGESGWIAVAAKRFRKPVSIGTEEWVRILKETYQEIITGSHSDIAFNANDAGDSIAMKMAKGRSLIPKTPRDFYEYNKQLGKTGIAETLINSIIGASRELAVISKTGPRPKEWYNEIKAYARSLDPEFDSHFEAYRHQYDAAFYRMTFGHTPPAKSWQAKAFLLTQGVQYLNILGPTWLRAFSDFGVSPFVFGATHGENPIGMFLEIQRGYWNRFLTKSHKTSAQEAAFYGAFVDSGLKIFNAEVGGDMNDGVMRKMGEWLTTVNFMRRHDASMRATVGDITTRRLATDAKLEWNQLDVMRRQGLEGYGLNEKVWPLIRKAVFKDSNGIERVTPESILNVFEKDPEIVLRVLGALDGKPIVLEKTPSVRSGDSSVYVDANGFSTKPAEVPVGGEQFVSTGKISSVYNASDAAIVAELVHDRMVKAGHSGQEAGTISILYATMFDGLAKVLGKSSKELFSFYGHSFHRLSAKQIDDMIPGAIGFFAKRRGKTPDGLGTVTDTRIATLKDAVYNPNLIHEASHFFHTVINDVYNHPGLGEQEKSILKPIMDWVGDKSVASNERLANGFEAYIRHTIAPPGMERAFAEMRDWYRRMLFLARIGITDENFGFTLSHPESAPQGVRETFQRLLGGGAAEDILELTSALEVLPPSAVTQMYGANIKISPNYAGELAMNIGNLINDHADIATTTPDDRARLFMFGGTSVNDASGMLRRIVWQMKSSALAQVMALRRVMESGPTNAVNYSGLVASVAMSAGLWALGKQISNLTQGKKTERMDTPEFALQAIAASGGLGIFIDSAVMAMAQGENSQNKFNRAARAVMPPVAFAWDNASTLVNTLVAMAQGEKIPREDIAKRLTGLIPYQNVFWVQFLLYHGLLNMVKEMIAPGILRKEERNYRKRGGEYIVPPRESLGT